MNRKQLIAMWVTIVLIVLIGIKPPLQHYSGGVFKKTQEIKIDVPRLIGYWVAVGTIGAGAIYSLKNKKGKKLEKDKD